MRKIIYTKLPLISFAFISMRYLMVHRGGSLSIRTHYIVDFIKYFLLFFADVVLPAARSDSH